MRKKNLLIVMVFCFLLTGCKPVQSVSVKVENGKRATIELYEAINTRINVKKMCIIHYSGENEYEIPFAIISDDEKQEKEESFDFFCPANCVNSLIAREDNDGNIVMHWLIPIINESDQTVDYWIYMDADYRAMGLSDDIIGVHETDKGLFDFTAYALSAYIK